MANILATERATWTVSALCRGYQYWYMTSEFYVCRTEYHIERILHCLVVVGVVDGEPGAGV